MANSSQLVRFLPVEPVSGSQAVDKFLQDIADGVEEYDGPYPEQMVGDVANLATPLEFPEIWELYVGLRLYELRASASIDLSDGSSITDWAYDIIQQAAVHVVERMTRKR